MSDVTLITADFRIATFPFSWIVKLSFGERRQVSAVSQSSSRLSRCRVFLLQPNSFLGFTRGESGGGKSTTTLPHSHSAARVSPPWYNVNSTRLGSRAHLLFLFHLCDVILVCVVSVRPRSNVMNFSTHVMHMGVRPYITVSWCYDAWNQFPIKRNMLQLISYQWNYMLYKISMKF